MEIHGRRMQMGKRYHKPGTAPGTLRAPESSRCRSGPGHRHRLRPGPPRREAAHRTIEQLLPLPRHADGDLDQHRRAPATSPCSRGSGKHFGFHPLTLEDVLNCGQRPKIEDYGDYHFMVMKSLYLKDEEAGDRADQLLPRPATTSSPSRRCRATPSRPCASASASGKGQIRKMGPDYLPTPWWTPWWTSSSPCWRATASASRSWKTR